MKSYKQFLLENKLAKNLFDGGTFENVPDYVYHSTKSDDDFKNITQTGLIPQNHKHNYFWYKESTANSYKSYIGNKGPIIRIHSQNLPNELYVTTPNEAISTPHIINSQYIEIKQNGQWKSIK